MRKLLLFVTAFVVLVSCKDENNINDHQTADGGLKKWTSVPSSDVHVITDNQFLAGRVNYGVVNTFKSSIGTRAEGVTTAGIPEEAVAAGFMELATVSSPTNPSGSLLSATAVQTYGKYAIVCYHMHYKGIGGALQLLDISVPTDPKVISELYYEGLDFNHITFDNAGDIANSKFWAAADDSKNGYAYVISGRISKADFTTEGIQKMRIPGNSANCIVKYGDNVIVTTTGTGETNGTILSFDYNTGVIDEDHIIEVQRGKHVAIDPVNPAAGLLALYLKDCDNNNNTMNQTSTGLPVLNLFADNTNPLQGSPVAWELERIKPIDGKNAIRFYDGKAYMALSNKGMLVLDVATGTTVKKNLPDDGLTNGVDADGRYIYLANGSGGVHVYNKATLDYMFTFYGNTEASANFTSASEEAGLLFIAYGIDGVKIICTKNCQPKQTCDQFMKVLFGETTEYFKEAYSVFRSDAHENIKTLFSDAANMPKYLEITKNNTTLYITFLREVTGWQNSFGYFVIPAGIENLETYYNANIKPDLTSNVVPDTRILFKFVGNVIPNTGKPAGTLQEGTSYVQIPELNVGDKVFFFLVPKGYDSSNDRVITTNAKVITTNPLFNEFNDVRPVYNGAVVPEVWRKLMHGLFLTESCKSIVYAIEDCYLNETWSDSDYNDIIFSISDNRNDNELSAIKLDAFRIVDGDGQMK